MLQTGMGALAGLYFAGWTPKLEILYLIKVNKDCEYRSPEVFSFTFNHNPSLLCAAAFISPFFLTGKPSHLTVMEKKIHVVYRIP